MKASCHLCGTGTNPAVVCRSCSTIVVRQEREHGAELLLVEPHHAVAALLAAHRPANPARVVAYLRRRAGWRRGQETMEARDPSPAQLAYVRELAHTAGVEDPTPEVGSAADASRQIARLRAVLRRDARAVKA